MKIFRISTVVRLCPSLFSTLILALVLVTFATGQDKAPPKLGDASAAPSATQQEPPVVLKVTTRLVTVDVVARDRRGSPVRDLKADDFEVFEQGNSKRTRQQIASFRPVDRSMSTAPDLERAALKIPAGVFTNLVTLKKLAAPPTILLVDGLNTDSASQIQVRQKMVQLLGSAPGDVPVAVFLMGRNLRLLQNFTTDPKLLKAAAQRALTGEASNLQIKDPHDDSFSNTSLLEEMAGGQGLNDIPGGVSGPNFGGPGSSGGTGGLSDALVAMKAADLARFEKEQYAESIDARVRLTLEALRLIARHVSGYPGRKNLIWISSTFPLVIMPDQNAPLYARFSGLRNYSEEIAGVASALTDAQIAVYPVDPRGLETQGQLAVSAQTRINNPFAQGATLNRQSNLRFSEQESMQDIAEQTGGQVCVNDNDLSECVKRAIDDGSSYYELAYYPTDTNWRGEFRRINLKTRRSGVQLSFREGYFARASDSTISAEERKDTDTRVMHAACNDFLSATSILLTAKGIPAEQPGQASYFLAIDPHALSFGAPEGGVRNLHIDLAACMFSAQGLPLQYFRQSVDQKFTEAEYQSTMATGVTHTLSIMPKPETARVRLLVCDASTGMIGSVDLPYTPETRPDPSLPAEKKDTASGSQARAAASRNGTSAAESAPHIIKFHDSVGHVGMLQWDGEKIFYSGDLSPEASARGMFDSLWGKSYSCETGKLVAINDKTTPAQQPLHFKTGESHVVEVYLDGADGVKYSGNVTVDPSVKPLFEALRAMYQCRVPAPSSPK